MDGGQSFARREECSTSVESHLVPEGDTIYRSARSLEQWIGGLVVTGATLPRRGLHAGDVLVGTTVTGVSALGKHLFIYFSERLVLHSHMRMSGAWRVASRGELPERLSPKTVARLECSDRLAICYSAPVLDLWESGGAQEAALRRSLGESILGDEFDVGVAARRIEKFDPEIEIGVVLLDQRVAAGIGNIYRCEALFACKISPKATLGTLSTAQIVQILSVARNMMLLNTKPQVGARRNVGRGPSVLAVHGRGGSKCRECTSTVVSELFKSRYIGEPRWLYFCPQCQTLS